MNRRRGVEWGVAVVMLSCLFGGTIVSAEQEVKMEGSYVWQRSDKDIPGEIEAVFTSTGEKAWDVVFHFEWEGKMRVWRGTARGDLRTGELEGEATEDLDDDSRGIYLFKGSVKDGVFTGEHGAKRDGEMNHMGTITLKTL